MTKTDVIVIGFVVALIVVANVSAWLKELWPPIGDWAAILGVSGIVFYFFVPRRRR